MLELPSNCFLNACWRWFCLWNSVSQILMEKKNSARILTSIMKCKLYYRSDPGFYTLVNFTGLMAAISPNAYIHILLPFESADGLWIQINQDCKLCFACLFLLFWKTGHKRRRLHGPWRKAVAVPCPQLPWAGCLFSGAVINRGSVNLNPHWEGEETRVLQSLWAWASPKTNLL